MRPPSPRCMWVCAIFRRHGEVGWNDETLHQAGAAPDRRCVRPVRQLRQQRRQRLHGTRRRRRDEGDHVRQHVADPGDVPDHRRPGFAVRGEQSPEDVGAVRVRHPQKYGLRRLPLGGKSTTAGTRSVRRVQAFRLLAYISPEAH